MEKPSEEYMEYLRLFELGYFAEASAKLDEAVSLRDPLALHTRAYEAEESDPPRLKEALSLYKMAAQQGYEPSIMNLVRHYEMKHNARWYLYWLKKAAAMGSPEAKEELNRPFPYLVSRAVFQLESGKDIDKAITVFRLAARHGNIDAMVNLANIYDLRFSPPRTALAEKLYKSAAARGSKVAALNLLKHYDDLRYRNKYIRHADISSRLRKLQP